MKRVLLSFVLILVTYSIHAQNNKFEIGIEGGPDIASYSNFPKYTGNYQLPAFTPSPLYAYSFGITGLYLFSDRFSIKSALSLEEKGFVDHITFTDNSGAFIKTVISPSIFNYLVLPVLARYSFGDKTKFFVNAGPYFGYLLNAKSMDAFSNSSNSNKVL